MTSPLRRVCATAYLTVVLLPLLSGPLLRAATSEAARTPTPKKKAAAKPTPPPKRQGNTLDAMVRDVVVGGEPLILNYQMESGFCVLNINPRIWNALSRGEQQQVGDMLAGSRAWSELGLINARLIVYRTEVGRVKPNWSGGKEFVLK